MAARARKTAPAPEPVVEETEETTGGAKRGPGPLAVAHAGWIKAEYGVDIDPEALYLAQTTRREFRQSDDYQAALEAVEAAKEQKAAERAKRAEERAAKASAETDTEEAEEAPAKPARRARKASPAAETEETPAAAPARRTRAAKAAPAAAANTTEEAPATTRRKRPF